MDQDAINLAKAIRQAETGNKPVAGKSGELKSRYQFLPSTWKSWSKQYLGIDNAPLTLENENKVAYSKIKELKDKGLNPAQIASVWNSGSTKWEGKVGVNKQGVKYDVPLYVNRVYSEYQKIKGVGPATGASLRSQYEQRQPQPPTVQMQRIERQQQGLPVARNENRVEPTFVGGMVREALGGGIAKLGESIRAIPKAIRGEDINKPRYSKYLGKEVSRIGAGFDVTKGLTKENLNALKDSGAVGLEFTSYLPITGVVGKTARAIPTLSKLLVKQAGKVALKRIGMNVVEGTVGTAMYEGARRLQGEKDRGNFFENVAYGGVGGLAFGTLGAGLSRGIRQGRRTLASLGGKIPEDIVTESTQRLKGAWRQLVDNYKDLRTFRNKQAKYGRNIEEVLTDEVLVPEIKEGKVDTQKLLPEVDNRIKAQAEQLSEYAKKFDFMPIKIDEVQKVAEKVIRDTPSLTATGEYRTALNELERRMTGLREIYGETIVPSQLNTIRVEMNKITKAFGGDVFKQDVADAIADAVREKLDNVIQDDAFRRGNAKVGDLINVRKFLQKVDGKQVGGGRFSQAFAGMAGAWAFGGIEKLPVVGDIAGYLVGRELSKQARQYAFGKAGPRTRAILRRMQRKNAIGEEIAQKSAKVEQKLLPARTSSVNKVYGTGKTIELPKRATSTVDKAEMANRALEKIKVGDNIKIDVKEMEVTRKVADGVVAKDDGGIKKFIPKEQLGEQAFGAVAGIQTDEDGNLTFDKKSALAGVAGLAVAKKAGILPKAGVYKGEKDLTTKILKDLEGKTTVSKQYILDATNRGELKQVERDLIRDILERETKVDTALTFKNLQADDYNTGIFGKDFDEPVKFYRGGTLKPNSKGEMWFTPEDWQALKYSEDFDAPSVDKVSEAFINSKKPFLLEGSEMGAYSKEIKDNWKKIGLKETDWNINDPKVKDKAIAYAKKNGYDSVFFRDSSIDGQTPMSSLVIFDEKLAKYNKIGSKVERTGKEQLSDTINVSDFAKKVKAELLPLKANNPLSGRYENIALPNELRGNVKNYEERIYESPIKTSAGETHFSKTQFGNELSRLTLEERKIKDTLETAKRYGETLTKSQEKQLETLIAKTKDKGHQNYFGHTRIEDTAADPKDVFNAKTLEEGLKKGKYTDRQTAIARRKELADLKAKIADADQTRRVIEVQSDLYQKGNLERELSAENSVSGNKISSEKLKELYPKKYAEIQSKQKLQQYNDPTAHFRMIREEIKKAAQDGKTKLQFPTGETAMKIEGLGSADKWGEIIENGRGGFEWKQIKPEDLKIGKEVSFQDQDEWIITDVLGDGEFKAVPKVNYDLAKGNASVPFNSDLHKMSPDQYLERLSETFDISGKVDTSNPIYKFYEKDVQKYLNKFGGKRVVDEKGVSWIEVPIKKEWAKMPVEAFALFPLFGIGKEKVIEDNDEYTTTKSGLFGNKISVTRKNIPELQPVEKPILEQSRNVIIKKEDINELKAILFGEISNRDISKKELEVRVILNTVLNRVKQNKDRGKDKSVTDVLTQKNQYQAYQGQQYYKYLEGDLDDLGKKKKEELDKIVEKIIAEIESGTFEDNTNGAVFYIHNPDGTITYRSGSLFK